MWLFFAFFLGFAVKIPMFPVHTWLPDAHVEAPTGGSVVLAAIMLKIGGYGFLRFSLPIVPDASHEFAMLMIALSLIAIRSEEHTSELQSLMRHSYAAFCLKKKKIKKYYKQTIHKQNPKQTQV